MVIENIINNKIVSWFIPKLKENFKNDLCICFSNTFRLKHSFLNQIKNEFNIKYITKNKGLMIEDPTNQSIFKIRKATCHKDSNYIVSYTLKAC
jgi:hypothetical protein